MLNFWETHLYNVGNFDNVDNVEIVDNVENVDNVKMLIMLKMLIRLYKKNWIKWNGTYFLDKTNTHLTNIRLVGYYTIYLQNKE